MLFHRKCDKIMDVDTGSLPCPLCKTPHFDDVHSLRSTLISVATTQLSCPVCNESLMGLDKFTIHLFSHVKLNAITTETTVGEDVGAKEYPKKKNSEISQTIELETINSVPDTIVCDICEFTFTDRTILDLHQKLLHHTSPDKETGIYNFHCHLCSKKFKMRGSLIVHLRVAHYGFAKSNGEKDSVGSSASKESVKGVDSKQWECDICFKMFTTKYFLKKHKRLHTGEMPYTCTQCNKSFTFQQSYHKHMLYHSSEKPHTCTECGRSFKELSTLQNHLRIHSGERPFSCESCGKSFRQRVSYLVHRRIHTGVMPYDCKICGKKFRYKVSQRSHKCVPTVGSSASTEKNATNCAFSTEQSEKKNTQLGVWYEDGNVLKKDEHTKCLIVDSPDSRCFYDFSSRNNNVTDDNITTISSCTQDLYSMILSPLLPDVESLCLNSADMNNCTQTKVTNEQRHNSENIFSNAHFSQRN